MQARNGIPNPNGCQGMKIRTLTSFVSVVELVSHFDKVLPAWRKIPIENFIGAREWLGSMLLKSKVFLRFSRAIQQIYSLSSHRGLSVGVCEELWWDLTTKYRCFEIKINRDVR